VVAFEESAHPVTGQVVLGIKTLGRVAFAADLLGYFQRGTGLETFDPVFRMAVGAGGRVPFALGSGAAVNAVGDIAGLLVVALAASFRLPREMEWRGWQVGRNHLVRVVAVLATGRIRAPGFPGQPMHAGPVTFGLPFVAGAAIHGFGGQVVIRVLDRDVSVATGAGIGLMRRGRELERIDEQRDFLARRVGLRERFVRVTFQADAVPDFLGPGCRGGYQAKQGCANEERNPGTHTSKASGQAFGKALRVLAIIAQILPSGTHENSPPLRVPKGPAKIAHVACPEGTGENSPAIYRWGHAPPQNPS
jgi:hypothetical protein